MRISSKQAFVGIACLVASSAFAQSRVTVHGVVYDSLHARPLAGASVNIFGTAITATTDSAGRFVLESIAPGTYSLVAQHEVIDAIGMSAIGGSFTVAGGLQTTQEPSRLSLVGRDTIKIFVPTFAQLWRFECGSTPPASDTGFVFGTVRKSRGAKRGGVVVAATWIDLASNGRSVSQRQKTLEVDADPDGNFALCGVPTGTGLSIHATADSAESGSFDLPPLDKQRIARRDLRLVSLRPEISNSSGAILTGHVFADSGRGPIEGAEVSLVDVGFKDTTTTRGEYRFSGVIPGSHTLHVRRIGYGEAESRVELEEGETRELNVVLTRITMLDSMNVVGKHLARDEAMRVFEEHRKIGLGHFLTEADLAKANGRRLPSMLQQFNNVRIYRTDDARWVANSTRGSQSLKSSTGCLMHVYIDGVRDRMPDLDIYGPDMIAGVEVYVGPAQIPPEYAGLGSTCGVIVINTKRK